MPTNQEIRDFAQAIDADTLPRESVYRVMVASPRSESEPVSEPIKGYYHAMYVRDRIKEEMGYAGVSFYLDKVTEDWKN